MQPISQYLTKEGWKRDWYETKSDAKKGLESILNAARGSLNLYRNNRYVNMNANVLAAAFPSIEAAARTSCCLEAAGCSKEAITAGAVAADWLAYIPVHIGLHYWSNRERFISEGKFDTSAFWKDVGRVYFTQIPSIVFFYVMASPFQYGLMQVEMCADTANRVAFWGTLVATRTLHTYNFWRVQNSTPRNTPKDSGN